MSDGKVLSNFGQWKHMLNARKFTSLHTWYLWDHFNWAKLKEQMILMMKYEDGIGFTLFFLFCILYAAKIC